MYPVRTEDLYRHGDDGYIFYVGALFRCSSFPYIRARARPIRFKKLSIAVPRSVKRAEVPGACYVPTMRILRLRGCRGSRIRNSFLSDGYSPTQRSSRRRAFAAGDEFGFYPDGKPEELYCTGRNNPPSGESCCLPATNQLNTINRGLLTKSDIFGISISCCEETSVT